MIFLVADQASTFCIEPGYVCDLAVNLWLGNMAWEDWEMSCAAGVFRGFPKQPEQLIDV